MNIYACVPRKTGSYQEDDVSDCGSFDQLYETIFEVLMGNSACI